MPEQLDSTLPAGLLTRDHTPVPLEGVAIEADLSTFCARVAVSQRYVNRESQPIEAVYVFPLDEGAAVCGFEAVIDGTLVVGEVKEREDAFRLYDDAIERGHGAFLLDEERPDVFQASVGNLPPGKEVLLKLTYVTELAVHGAGLRFTIPTTVSPRYAPASDQRGVGRPDSVTLNPPVAWQVPYGLNLNVRLNMAGAITTIESPSHPVSVSLNGNAATVSLSKREAALDRDFVLSLDVEGLDQPRAWIERDDTGHHAVALAFAPAFERTTVPSDITFVVDRSGSMEGSSIEEVRNALQLCLRSLVAGCSFNIVGFGSTHETLFPEHRPYDDASLAAAAAHVSAMRANLGGTEILPALAFVLGQPRTSGRTRQVVILTDGQVTNTDAVLALVAAHVADARVFTFGIGAGASQHLVKAIARASGGSAEFIHPGERIEPKVVRQLGRILSPALTNVAISWGGLDARQAPSALPPVFAGERLLLYAFLDEVSRSQTPTRATLSATSPSGTLAFDVVLDPAASVEGRTVCTLAARARIRELEESPESTTARGSRQRERKADGVSREIIELAVRYGLMSRETSYVAIERRETPVTGDMQLRRVPIALTSGWGGLDARAPMILRAGSPAFAAPLTLGAPSAAMDDGLDVAMLRASAPRRPGAPAAEREHGGIFRRSLDRLNLSNIRLDRAGRAGGAGGKGSSSTSDDGTHAAMVALISLQHANGSWDLDPDLARLIGRDLDVIERSTPGATGAPEEIRQAWATALALVWLDQQARRFAAEWTLAADKGRRWLERIQARPAVGGSWPDAARAMTATSLPRR
jgi:Ca-activated chloride channel family protein